MYDQLLMKHNHFILWLSCIADISSMRKPLDLITDLWLNIWLTLSIMLFGFSGNALWESYSTTFMILTSFLFLYFILLVIVQITFFTFVHCYPCRKLHYIQSVPLCLVISHHVYVYMCDHLKNKSPIVQYFVMFASPDYYSNLCIHKGLLKNSL